MASITSLSNSSYNTSSIYGNRNIISGLASGMDTEAMIENAVSGIKLKIQNLQKKRTKIGWQQEAYRSIIDKAVNFNNKYTSYSSKTNLLSNSFFSNAVNTTTVGTYKDKITASGKTSSEVKINAVKQMARAATYTVSGLGGTGSAFDAVLGTEDFDIAGKMDVSTVSGRLSFKYGGTNGTDFDIKFDELEDLREVEVLDADGNVKENASDAEKLAQAIRNKLSEITYSYTKNGVKETTTADKVVKVEADGISNAIKFSNGMGDGNKVTISYVSGKFEDLSGAEKGSTQIRLGKPLTEQVSTLEYLGGKIVDGENEGGKTLSVTLDGVTKKIDMSELAEKKDLDNDGFVEFLQDKLNDAFGQGKVQVGMDGKNLSFRALKEGSTLTLGGSAVEAMGFESGDSNFINPSKKLSDLLGKDSELLKNNRLKGTFDSENGKPTEKTSSSGEKYYVDDKGNRVDKDGYRITDKGKSMYDFEVNGAHINVTEDTTLEELMNSINSNAEAGMKVSYSKLTNEFKFTATETGANSKVEFGGLAEGLFGPPSDVEVNHNFGDNFGIGWLRDDETSRLTVKADGIDGVIIGNIDVNKSTTMQEFAKQLQENSGSVYRVSYDEKTGKLTVTDQVGKEQDITVKDQWGDSYERVIEPVVNYTAGQDAIMDVEINGKRFENLTRSSNSFDIDGLTVNVKGTFNEDGKATGKDGEAYEPITFNTTTDSDKIVEAIRSFVEDYNEMATEIKNAYSTQPAYKNKTTRYEPLTAEQEDQYSESELKAYNEKAKQGILFGDTNLSSMYSKLLSSISPGGTDGQTLREIGISTSYNNGMTTLSLDEDKLRDALESDPDKVRNAFTKTQEGGSSTNGLMQSMQNTLNAYVKTAGEPKGVLIARAGSVKSPTSLNNNSLKSQMDNIDNQIDRWTDKMADQIDRYTTQFSRLEQLIAQMNSQASAMSGLMGGASGY